LGDLQRICHNQIFLGPNQSDSLGLLDARLGVASGSVVDVEVLGGVGSSVDGIFLTSTAFRIAS